MWRFRNFAKYSVHISPDKNIIVECYKIQETEDKKSIQFFSPKAGTSFAIREGWIDGIMDIVAEFERDNIIGYELITPLGLRYEEEDK